MTESEVLAHVDRVPRTATEIHREVTGMPLKSLNRAERRERRHVAALLQNLAYRKVIHRGVIESEGHTWIGFWRYVDADAPGDDQP